MTKEFLCAENVEIGMETLRIAQGRGLTMLHQRAEAAIDIVEALLKGASPEDRQRYEAYLNAHDPCYAEER
ncbi:MAG: hypothetical protein ABSF21_01005 [Dehalococcoidia bacterium]